MHRQKEKEKSEFQKIKETYTQWEDFMSRSKIKMRKKMKKDKQEYYDFDYTRGQYYYSYPQEHINFVHPDLQLTFFKDLLKKETQQFTQTVIDHDNDKIIIENDLRPLQLHEFLRSMHQKLHQRISALRIRKTFYIRQNLENKEFVDLMEAEIRSFFYRYERLKNIFFSFDKPLSSRLEGASSSLKLKNFDQLHFSELEKGDFVIFLRMETVRQRVEYPLDCLLQEVKLKVKLKKGQIQGSCWQERSKSIKQLEKYHGQKYLLRRQRIEKHFKQNNIEFLESEENLQLIENYLCSLNFIHMYSRHRAEFGKAYLDGTKLLLELPYIPTEEDQLKSMLFSISSHYFPKGIIEDLYQNKRQNLCYRLNYFASILLKTISESNNFLLEIKEKDLHQYRNSMKRQLETIFTSEVDSLFNLPEHEIIALVDEGSYELEDFSPPFPSQQQVIFQEYFRQNELQDPISKAILNLLDAFSQKQSMELAEKQAKLVIDRSKSKLKYLALYYRNLHSDQKSHLISLINSKVLLGMVSENMASGKLDSVLWEKQLDLNLLKTTYLLLLIRSIHLKRDLDHALTAQISLMYKLKYRLSLLKYKDSQPFQMSEEFMSRFMESNGMPQPFQFINQQQKSVKKKYPDPQLHDKIIRKYIDKQQKVEVRRMMPENPLFQGKKILYRQALKESDKLLAKIHQTCAYLIQRRENYLFEEGFTNIVDRFQLVRSLLHAELNFQLKKVTYLEELTKVMQCTINPRGLSTIARCMVEAKTCQVYLSFSQFHCLEQYAARGDTFERKAQILSVLRTRQTQAQQQQKQQFRDSIAKHNHLNNVPEISSIYYCDELPMEMETDNIMEVEEESCSDFSQSQFVANSSKLKSDFSAISSDYHVKATFKQILGRSSINTIAADQNRRQELKGRKKKKLLNDSVLGGLLTYNKCNDYLYIHRSVQFMKQLQKLCESEDYGVQKQFYSQIQNVIKDSTPEKLLQGQLVHQNLLQKILGDSSRAISKVVEKIKFTPTTLEDYLFMSSSIASKLISGSNGDEVNDIRGLYTCLNVAQLCQLHYQYFLLGQAEQKHVLKALTTLFKQHSSQQVSRQNFYLSDGFVLEQSYFPSQFRIVQGLKKNKQQFLQFLGNYSHYMRYAMLLNHVCLNYYKNSLLYFGEQVSEYELLKQELQSMETNNCYFSSTQLLKIPNIENKVYVHKKYQYLVSHKNRLFSSSIVKDFLSVPKAKLSSAAKISKREVTAESSIVENIQLFEQFLISLGVLVLQMEIVGEQIRIQMKEKKEIEKLFELCQVLPFIQTYVHIHPIQNSIMKDAFSDFYQHLASMEKPITGEQKSPQKMRLQCERVSFSALSRMHSSLISEQLKTLVKSFLFRKGTEFTVKEEDNLDTYYHYQQVQRYTDPFKLRSQPTLKDLFEFMDNYLNAFKLRLWLEAKIVCFGASLDKKELLQLRMVLSNPENNFNIFWVDESSQLIKHSEFVKMKQQNADQFSIKDQYTLRFITYQNLKVHYKAFLDNLADLDIKNQGLQILGLFYIANQQMFQSMSERVPDFLQNYCFLKKIKNKTSAFIEFAASTNPNRYMTSIPPMGIDMFKRFLWSDRIDQKLQEAIVLLQDRCGTIKQILNYSNTKMHQLTNQLGIQVYQSYRMEQLMRFLDIEQSKQDKAEYHVFLKKFQEDLLLGNDKLNKVQKYLSKFVEKIIKEKPELLSIKDEVLQKINQSRFNQRLILNKLFSLGRQTLFQELQLTAVLQQNYAQKELMRDNRIIKATLNKVLVPKIIINPYLQSPLLLQNYFFAGCLKLSFVDSFLNRLKNRAIMVELAEGGFGFLLKITQLDECVQNLCKGVITFTEKEFNDRFRSYFQAHEQLYEKYRKSEIQNNYLKNIVQISKQQRGKQLRSMLYSKLDSYLITMHTKEKTYNSVFNILKSMEMEITKKVSLQFQDKIDQLVKQNNQLKAQFASFKHILNHNAMMEMEESRDTLFNTFKKDIESLLNKEIFKKHQFGKKESTFEEHKEKATQSLLKRLRTQKLFYEMKVETLESKLKTKTEQINHLHHELTVIQSTLASEVHKGSKMTDEIKSMHLKNIKIQELKKEISKREEQETINKFKLIKINQNLQGKLSRLEDKKANELKSIEQSRIKQERSLGVQTQQHLEKPQPRNFRIKTETFQSVNTVSTGKFESEAIWKGKWEHSERKYQLLMSKVMQAFESYSVNKNWWRLAQRMQKICEQCGNNKIVKKS